MMGKEEVESIAETVAHKTVHAMFQNLGIRHEDIYETQRDFAFLREWRQTCEMVRGKGLLTVLSITVTGIIGLIILGLRQYFN